MSHDLSHDLSIYTPVLKGPRVCNTTTQGAPTSKWHHEDQGALQTGQGQGCGKEHKLVDQARMALIGGSKETKDNPEGAAKVHSGDWTDSIGPH